MAGRFLSGAAQLLTIRYAIARVSQVNLLDFRAVLIQCRSQLILPTRFTPPFFEEVMKWACLKYLDLCLPEANARGEAVKIIFI